MSNQPLTHEVGAEVLTEIIGLHSELTGLAHRSLEAAVRLGELLTVAKNAVGHGRWSSWLSDNVPFTCRTARRYMLVYDHRERLKTDNVSDLSAAYAALCTKAQSENDDHKWLGEAIENTLSGMETLLTIRSVQGYKVLGYETFEDYLSHEHGMDGVTFNARLVWCKDYLAAWGEDEALLAVVIRFLNSEFWKSRKGASKDEVERIANVVRRNSTT